MNKYQQIKQLSEEQRLDARDRAASIVVKAVGDKPKRDDFNQITVSKYPQKINNLIMALVVIVLAAAFVPSAIRLYTIGSETFIQGVNDARAAALVGIAIVLMAETSQILFSVASVVLETTRATRFLLYWGMAAATALALVGNAQVALPGHWTNPFAWFEALLPPLLVLSTAYILKQQLLTLIEQRHGNERAYQEALQEWQIATSNPEKHSRYKQALANAIRSEIRNANNYGTGKTKRVELMQSFSAVDWRILVQRELAADEWYTNDKWDALQSEETVDDESTEDSPFGYTVPEMAELANGKMLVSVNGNGGASITANGKN